MQYASNFLRAYKGATELRTVLFGLMDQLESLTDRIKVEPEMTPDLTRLNRQIWTTLEEVNTLQRMVTAAELGMEEVKPMVEEGDMPIEVLEGEGVFRPDWMVFTAVEVSDD